uniref:8.9 kDa family member n=1 Tax=Rhipicephalus appendiculatus TaxID=34631 RepID=A0A131Z1P5_RHIAP
MAKLHTCFVTITTAILFLVDVSQQGLEFQIVPFENGKCQFNGDKVDVGQSVKDTKRCISWSCVSHNSTHASMIASSCPRLVFAPPPCKYVPGRPGVYPDCCAKAECPKKR